ncbi:MAG: glycosyltransferase family 1 protein [Beijerinckiaceae bacterium]|nr:glycosyltransferase family 1 protein [Beijerinckiaceae bacterium]
MAVRVLVVTDAWLPQINGVVRSIEALIAKASTQEMEISLIFPGMFRTFPLPTYPEIRLAFKSAKSIAHIIREREPDCIHIATEGPLGFAAQRACKKNGWRFSTAYHTRFPEYIAERKLAPASLIYRFLNRFHSASEAVLVATKALETDLRERGFQNLVRWTRGVDTALFRPATNRVRDRAAPVFIYVGRISIEKNIEQFLRLELPGRKVVVGDGPDRKRLQKAYPSACFTGALEGEALAAAYASADVFVFPSRTDTFGLVLLEALASGLPIAAFPVMGPRDVIGDSGCGVMSEDLRAAAIAALAIPSQLCVDHAARFSWDASVRQFAVAVRLGHPALEDAISASAQCDKIAAE